MISVKVMHRRTAFSLKVSDVGIGILCKGNVIDTFIINIVGDDIRGADEGFGGGIAEVQLNEVEVGENGRVEVLVVLIERTSFELLFKSFTKLVFSVGCGGMLIRKNIDILHAVLGDESVLHHPFKGTAQGDLIDIIEVTLFAFLILEDIGIDCFLQNDRTEDDAVFQGFVQLVFFVIGDLARFQLGIGRIVGVFADHAFNVEVFADAEILGRMVEEDQTAVDIELVVSDIENARFIGENVEILSVFHHL